VEPARGTRAPSFALYASRQQLELAAETSTRQTMIRPQETLVVIRRCTLALLSRMMVLSSRPHYLCSILTRKKEFPLGQVVTFRSG